MSDVKKLIKFNLDLIPKIKEEKKTSSLRLGLKPFTIGEIPVYDVDYGLHGHCFINKVEIVTLGEIKQREDIIKNEGYENFSQLEEVLIKIYGDKIGDATEFTYVRFYYLGLDS